MYTLSANIDGDTQTIMSSDLDDLRCNIVGMLEEADEYASIVTDISLVDENGDNAMNDDTAAYVASMLDNL